MTKDIGEILSGSISSRTIKKLILSKPVNKDIKRAEGRLIELKGEVYFQLEIFMSDGKALHRNIKACDAAKELLPIITDQYKQTNLLSSGGECEIKISSAGKMTVINKIKDTDSTIPAEIASHNNNKHYILSGEEANAFLFRLGVCDEKGNVFDKKRSKFRQINRFLEILDDVYTELPNGKLTVCDLCCGKSYLTFAVYYYLVTIKKRDIDMYGVDLKNDVIEYCDTTAKELGFNNLHFVCGDVSEFVPPAPPQLVISLHACDTATDYVLASAVKNRAKVILSTPCCHHEMMHQISCASLSFIEQHSILKQKLCDAATDALRVKRLEAEGYTVAAIELIDPEETPKNVMLKAVYRNINNHNNKRNEEAYKEYLEASEFLRVDLTLDKLLTLR